jgi:hypothetical protein
MVIHTTDHEQPTVSCDKTIQLTLAKASLGTREHTCAGFCRQAAYAGVYSSIISSIYYIYKELF